MGLRGACLLQLCTQGLGLVQQRLYLHQVETRSRADLDAAPKDAQCLFMAGDHAVGQCDPLVEFTQPVVAIGDIGEQYQLHGVACLVGGEVVLQRGVLKVAHAAPEIQLPGVDAQTDLVTAAG